MANASILPLASYHVKAMSKGEAACAGAQESTFGILETVWLFGTTCRSLAALVSHVVQSMSGQVKGRAVRAHSAVEQHGAPLKHHHWSTVAQCTNKSGWDLDVQMSSCLVSVRADAMAGWRQNCSTWKDLEMWRGNKTSGEPLSLPLRHCNQGASKVRHVHPSSCPLFSRQARGP